MNLPSDIKELRDVFVSRGFEIRLVGGAVRDLLVGKIPHDYDFCTDANPIEQLEIYAANGIHSIPTGILHGTITVVLNSGCYEITSLRTEDQHDGRHASVTYTRSWEEDAARRDLTFNAMSMDFSGEVYDFFNGKEDLKNKLVRFVGDPNERMKEDYLRILRWIRFHAKISPGLHFDPVSRKAAKVNAPGLRNISKERVWSEVRKIIMTDECHKYMSFLYTSGIADYIALPVRKYTYNYIKSVSELTDNPVTRMVSLLGEKVLDLADDWKWSNAEENLAKFLIDKFSDWSYIISFKHEWKRALINNTRRDYVIELLCLTLLEQSRNEAENWEIPVFPINGNDALSRGLEGKEIGEFLNKKKDEWWNSDFSLSREQLLKI
jgi:tRNA nucleotidyltransferase (CCA-adding enzyme)